MKVLNTGPFKAIKCCFRWFLITPGMLAHTYKCLTKFRWPDNKYCLIIVCINKTEVLDPEEKSAQKLIGNMQGMCTDKFIVAPQLMVINVLDLL